MSNHKKTEEYFSSRVKDLIKKEIKSERNISLYILDKEKFKEFKKEFSLNISRDFARYFSKLVKGEIRFILPSDFFVNPDKYLMSYTNMNIQAIKMNKELKNKKIFVQYYFGNNPDYSFELIRVEKCRQPHVPPYDNVVYLAKYGNGKSYFSPNSHYLNEFEKKAS